MPSEPSVDRRPWLPRAARLVLNQLAPLLALVVVIGLFAGADQLQTEVGGFASARNARVILVQTATVAVAALGMTMVIISGGIDLSAGTALALSATVLAVCLRDGWPAAGAVMAAVVTGMVCGLINGLLISYRRIVPFIVTLGTMTIYLGAAKLLADETTVRPAQDQIPHWVRDFVSVRPEALWLGLPSGVWLVLCLAVLLSAVLHFTVFGRYVFALGSNEQTARLCGVNVPLVKSCIYALAGFFVGVGGIYQFARLSCGNPTSGIGLELRVIAAVVIGGGSLSGGQGSVLGTLTGAAIMGVIASGCTLLGLSNPVQDVLLGVIIVLAVSIDQMRQGRQE